MESKLYAWVLYLQVAAQAARQRRRKKRRTRAADSFCNGTFDDLYCVTGELLGEGAYAKVWTCMNRYTHKEYAVKVAGNTTFVYFKLKESFVTPFLHRLLKSMLLAIAA